MLCSYKHPDLVPYLPIRTMASSHVQERQVSDNHTHTLELIEHPLPLQSSQAPCSHSGVGASKESRLTAPLSAFGHAAPSFLCTFRNSWSCSTPRDEFSRRPQHFHLPKLPGREGTLPETLKTTLQKMQTDPIMWPASVSSSWVGKA